MNNVLILKSKLLPHIDINSVHDMTWYDLSQTNCSTIRPPPGPHSFGMTEVKSCEKKCTRPLYGDRKWQYKMQMLAIQKYNQTLRLAQIHLFERMCQLANVLSPEPLLQTPDIFVLSHTTILFKDLKRQSSLPGTPQITQLCHWVVSRSSSPFKSITTCHDQKEAKNTNNTL